MPDGPDVVVGRKDTGTYAAFPADGAGLLMRLQDGTGTHEAQRWYRERYGEDVDMADFVETLRDLGFVREPGAADAPAVPRRPRWHRLGRAAFSWPAWLLYAGVCGYALFLTAAHPSLRPGHEKLFFTPSFVLVEAGLFLGQIPGIFFHEAMHALAGRRLGVPSRLALGNRLHILVFETDLSGLWSVPRGSRYLPLLAGMLADLLWFSLLTISARLAGPHALPGTFFLALALATLLRLAWQFCFHLRTDVYQVLVTALRCVNLHRTTTEYLANRAHRVLRRAAPYDERRWHPRDRQVARWYSHLFVLGWLFTLGMLAWIGIPAAVTVLTGVAARLAAGDPFGAPFLDSCLVLLLNLVPPATVAVLVLRRRRAGRRAGPPARRPHH
ncbi:hypothetical protein ACVNF4_35060 [Streptomyces sp. S6]